MRLRTPVEVSLWTTITALMTRARSSDSFASIAAGSAPWRQSPARKLHLEAPAGRHLSPQSREMAGLGHQHRVAGRERVDDRGFPGAGSGGREDQSRARPCGTKSGNRRALPCRACRTRDRGDRSPACPSPGAPGPAPGSGQESAGRGVPAVRSRYLRHPDQRGGDRSRSIRPIKHSFRRVTTVNCVNFPGDLGPESSRHGTLRTASAHFRPTLPRSRRLGLDSTSGHIGWIWRPAIDA